MKYSHVFLIFIAGGIFSSLLLITGIYVGKNYETVETVQKPALFVAQKDKSNGVENSGIFIGERYFSPGNLNILNDELGKDLQQIKSSSKVAPNQIAPENNSNAVETYSNKEFPPVNTEDKVSKASAAKLVEFLKTIKAVFENSDRVDLDRGGVNLNKEKVNERIIDKFKLISNDSTINFWAENEKLQIIVFTDPTCAYCRKLHGSITSLVQAGISVRYILFPRAGVESLSAQQLSKIYCSAEPAEAVLQAYEYSQYPSESCGYAMDHVFFNWSMGVYFGAASKGTPTIISSSGKQIFGFSNANDLLKKLGM